MRDRTLRTSAYRHVAGEGVIRPTTEDDAPELARIMPLAFRDGSDEQAQYRNEDALRLMALGFGSVTAREAWFSFLVAEHPKGGIAGAMICRYGMHSNDPFMAPVYTDVGILDTLAVHPSMREAGVGRALLRRAEADMRNAGSRVMILQCPLSAARFYSRCGYHVENAEVACLTVFPRQGQKVFTSSRPRADDEQRLAWRSLLGARPQCTPYEHASRGEPSMMVRGVIPGDHKRFPGWPTQDDYALGRPRPDGKGRRRGPGRTGRAARRSPYGPQRRRWSVDEAAGE